MSRTTLRESRRSSNVLPGSHSQQYHSRGHSLTGFSIQTYENLDLVSISSRNLSVASSEESSNVSMKLGRYDVRSSELSKREVDDSSSSIDKGKHVYDWETDRSTSASTRSSSLARSVPSTEASKLSASEFSADHCTRPSRRSSQFSAYSSDRLSSVPHTSSASVLAYFGQSSPLTRSLSTPRSWASAGRVLLHRRTPAPAHRPSSPVPRLWSPQQPVVPLNRPPKIRSLPDRFLPVAAVTPKRNPETTSPRNVPRRYSRHMMQDINRNGTGTGTPQGFRAASEAQSVGSMGAPECINNTSVLEDGNYMSSAAEITSKSIDGRNMSSQLKGQSQPSEMKRGRSNIVYCQCLLPALIRAMMTEGNQGRRFYDCGRFQHFERCNFFRWVDGENCQSCEVVMPRIKCKLQECEDEITKIHLREAELLNEMNKIKELNTKLENTQREAEASQKQKIAKNYYYQWICRMCIFLIGILCAMVLSGLLEK